MRQLPTIVAGRRIEGKSVKGDTVYIPKGTVVQPTPWMLEEHILINDIGPTRKVYCACDSKSMDFIKATEEPNEQQ